MQALANTSRGSARLGASRRPQRCSAAPTLSRSSRARCVAVHASRLPKWDEVFAFLVQEKKLRTISPEEAQDLVNTGKWVLVDVRPPQQHQGGAPEGAVSVPMYQPLDWSKPDLGKLIKFVAYSANGVTPVEPNPDFITTMQKLAADGKGIITLCEAGGTLKPSTNFPFGKASRSLQAAYRCYTEGVTDQVLHLDRGVYGWWQADLPMTGNYKPEIGRTPQAAAEPMLQAIRSSTGYAMREGDKKTVEK